MKKILLLILISFTFIVRSNTMYEYKFSDFNKNITIGTRILGVVNGKPIVYYVKAFSIYGIMFQSHFLGKLSSDLELTEVKEIDLKLK